MTVGPTAGPTATPPAAVVLAARPASDRTTARSAARFRRNRLSVFGAAIVASFIVVAIIAPFIEPYPYAAFDIPHRLTGPSSLHWLGSDQFGRDILSRVLFGAQVSLTVALAGTAVGTFFGVLIGGVAGYVGGWFGEIAMRLMDIILAFPPIVLALAVAAVLQPSLQNVIGIIGFLIIPQFARVTRGAVLAVMNEEYVTATRVIGQTETSILLRHVLPNTLGPLVVLASLTIPGAILTEAALSYLGIGVQLPTPSWGNMIADGSTYLLQAPWLTLFPGLVISIAVLGFNLVGDGLRDALDATDADV